MSETVTKKPIITETEAEDNLLHSNSLCRWQGWIFTVGHEDSQDQEVTPGQQRN